jgi:protein phosphatase
LVQELIDSKKITAEEGKNHPQRNIVTRIVGYNSDLKVDTFCTNISYNDRILLCSDGLTDLVSDNEIKKIVLNSEYPRDVCNNLVMTANDYGGNDNISVILFSVSSEYGENNNGV